MVQCVAGCCSVLAVCCSVGVAVCWLVLLHISLAKIDKQVLQSVAGCYRVLHFVAVYFR